MSIVGAPLPPEPLPWENAEYEDNISEDGEESDLEEDYSINSESDIDYESDDAVPSFRPLIKNKKCSNIPVPYYKNILQEEEYFSE